MSKQKALEHKSTKVERLESLERLSAGIAHEINNPLGLILGYTQLLLNEAEPGDRFHEDLKTVEKHALNCKNIVEDLLSFSRSTEIAKIPVNLNDLVNEVLSVVQPRFDAKRILISKKLFPEPIHLKVDPEKVKQAFMNILINAEQVMDRDGMIRINTKLDDSPSRAVVSFKDTGPGIEPEIIHKIFDPFFTTRPTGKGNGLGLAVSYGVIRDHDGEIRVRSTPGTGSQFTVLLPLDGSNGRKK
ncbi:MAG: sensor histidine kinase [Thermodesulfobacteriota bacterium]